MGASKIKLFITGRIGQFPKIEQACKGQKNIVWVHAVSYGEFEEATPVIARIRETHPEVKILATFFSPSGYVAHKNTPLADWVFYLPIDTPANARRFLNAVNPIKVIFSISDYWLFMLKELRKRKIDTYLISGRFIPSMRYFKPVGKPYRTAFTKSFTKMMVRDELSSQLLKSIGVRCAPVIGDPRMDRVIAICSEEWSDPILDQFCGGEKVFIAGSTLPKGDDELVATLVNAHPSDKFMIIPHEIGDKEVSHIREMLKVPHAVYTEVAASGKPVPSDTNVLIVNTVGMLSHIYRYGYAAYVGGGFDGTGSPHSVVEPAVYGMPVSFGPGIWRYHHCQGLIDHGCGFSASTGEELCQWFDKIKSSPSLLSEMAQSARAYCYAGAGAAEAIVKEIFD